MIEEGSPQCGDSPGRVLLFFVLFLAFKFSQELRMLQKVLVLVLVLAGIAGCIGCSTSSHYVYATVPNANQLAAFREDPFSGSLIELSGSPYTVGDGANSVVLHPSGKFLYVANPGQGENDISLFSIQGNGTLIEVPPRTPVTPLGSVPQRLLMDPAGAFLYVANALSNNISIFAIDSSTGALTQAPGSPVSTVQTPLNMVLNPAGNLLFVSFASQPLGFIETFSVNAGTLQLLSPLTSSTGVNPSGLAVDPSGTYLYVANTQSNAIAIFTIGASGTPAGSLTPIQGSPLANTYLDPAFLLIDPKGQNLYVANQGSNNVAVYTLNASGLPVALTTSTSTFAFTTISAPSVLALDPNGGYLFVGNVGSSAAIQAFGVNSGNLNPLRTYRVGNSASSIVVTK
jgi:6-phosphogluconolactonase